MAIHGYGFASSAFLIRTGLYPRCRERALAGAETCFSFSPGFSPVPKQARRKKTVSTVFAFRQGNR
jgi:hypothetical protein